MIDSFAGAVLLLPLLISISLAAAITIWGLRTGRVYKHPPEARQSVVLADEGGRPAATLPSHTERKPLRLDLPLLPQLGLEMMREASPSPPSRFFRNWRLALIVLGWPAYVGAIVMYVILLPDLQRRDSILFGVLVAGPSVVVAVAHLYLSSTHRAYRHARAIGMLRKDADPAAYADYRLLLKLLLEREKSSNSDDE